MITTGTKYFFAIAIAAFVAALVYGATTELGGSAEDYFKGTFPWVDLPPGVVDALLGPLTLGYKGGVGDAVGYGILMGTSAVTALLGVMTSAVRDADAKSVAELDNGELGELRRPSLLSAWPLLGAFGAGCIVVGLAVSSLLVFLGFIVIGLVFIEWAVTAWAERATANPEVNRIVRNRFLFPLEVPVVGVIILGGVVILFSRVLLAVSKTGAVVAAGVVASLILIVASLIASRPQITRQLVTGFLVIGGALLLVGGVASAVIGERDIEEHEEHGEESHSEEEAFVVLEVDE